MRLTINIKYIIITVLPMFLMNCGNLPAVKYHPKAGDKRLDRKWKVS